MILSHLHLSEPLLQVLDVLRADRPAASRARRGILGVGAPVRREKGWPRECQRHRGSAAAAAHAKQGRAAKAAEKGHWRRPRRRRRGRKRPASGRGREFEDAPH